MKKQLICKTPVARLVEKLAFECLDMKLGPKETEREVKRKLDILIKFGEITHYSTESDKSFVTISIFKSNKLASIHINTMQDD